VSYDVPTHWDTAAQLFKHRLRPDESRLYMTNLFIAGRVSVVPEYVTLVWTEKVTPLTMGVDPLV